MFSNDIDFIQHIARLIYCAGSIDGDYDSIEKRESLAIIHDLSEREFGAFSEDLMIAEIKDLVENHSSTKELMDDFTAYYHEHQQLFSEEVKINILELLDRVIYAHAKRNKSELIFLSKLEILFFGKLL